MNFVFPETPAPGLVDPQEQAAPRADEMLDDERMAFIPGAPTEGLIRTAEHLALIVRADHYTGPAWKGAAIQDEAAHDLDAVLLELGRRQNS